MSNALEFFRFFLAKPNTQLSIQQRFASLYVCRLYVQEGGEIFSRPDLKNHRQVLERWRNKQRVWVHPEADAIVYFHALDLAKHLRLSYTLAERLDPDNRMPN
jgi:hypothetical protein